jgi:hypothetical protein
MKMLPGTRPISLESVKEKGCIDELRPTESDFKGKPGYERYHVVQETVGDVVVRETEVKGEAPDGGYKWRYRFQQNEHGVPTREAGAVAEKLKPWMRADSERQLGLQAQMPRTALKDEAGSAHYVPEHLTETAERRNGWRTGPRLLPTRTDPRHARRCSECHEFAYWCKCEEE